MPKKKPEDDLPKGEKNQAKPSSGTQSRGTGKEPPLFEISSADILNFRREVGDDAEHLSDEDIQVLSTAAQEMGRALGIVIDKPAMFEMLKTQLEEMDLDEVDEWDDEEEEETGGDEAEFDLDEWELFATQNFPTDFFDGAEALEKAAAVSNKAKRSHEIARITQDFPAHGQSWLELARLESNPDTAREYLHRALQANAWMLKLAAEHPERADGLRRAHIMLGLDVAGEFWMAGQRTDALEIQEHLLKIEDKDVGGQRLIYAFRLFEQGWFDELEEQLVILEKETQSEAAIWLLKSFILFVRDQDFEGAAEALKKSRDFNPMTFDTLLGGIELEDIDQMDQASPEVEAHWLGRVAMAPAASVDGLHRWMRDVLDYTAPELEGEESDNWENRINELLQIPQADSEWFLESRPLEGDYVTVIGETEEFEIVGFDQQDRMPKSDDLWEVLIDTIEYPEIDEPRRPKRLVVNAPSLEQAWKENCRRLDIELAFRDDLQVPDSLFDFVAKGISIAAEAVELDEATFQRAEELPRSSEVWVIGSYRPPIWITDSATPRRPWMNLVVNEESGLVRMQDMSDDVPADDFLAKTLVKSLFMSMVPDEEGCLPAEIRLCTEDRTGVLSELCDRLDIELIESDDDEPLTMVIDSIVQMSSPPDLRISMHESADLNEDDLESLYRDFALFYRAALWRSTHRDQYLEISAPSLERPKFFAKLIGQLGDYRGLYVGYQDEAFHEQVDDIPDPELFKSTVLNYDEAYSLCPTDLLFIERYGFEIAGENAFPMVQHCFAEQSFRRPDRSEVLEIQIAIRAVMALAERPRGSETEKLTLPTIEGPLEVGLRWVHY